MTKSIGEKAQTTLPAKPSNEAIAIFRESQEMQIYADMYMRRHRMSHDAAWEKVCEEFPDLTGRSDLSYSHVTNLITCRKT